MKIKHSQTNRHRVNKFQFSTKFIKNILPGTFIGLFATIIFTITIHSLPLLGFSKIDLSREITNRLFGNEQRLYLIGHAIHYLTGTAWAVVYFLFGRDWVATKVQISGFPPGISYGIIWSILAFMVSIIFLTLIGRNELVFTTGTITLLSAHLLYGVIIGAFLEYENA